MRAAPLLADVRVEWAEGVPWRDGSAAKRIDEECPDTLDRWVLGEDRLSALVVEGQYWPHRSRRKLPLAKMEAPELRKLVRDFESMLEDNGGRFNSLIGLAGCSGVVAGAAHIAGVPVFSAGATSWIPLLGRHGKAADGDNRKAYRRASVELMRLLGGPKRGNKRAAGHDLGAATALALLGLGVVRLEEQLVEPSPELAAWLAGI